MLRNKLGNGFVYGIAGLFAAAFAAINLTGIITLVVFLFSPLAFAGDGLEQNQQENAACLSCHGKAGFSIENNGVKQDLFVDPEQYRQSVHATRACVSCHGNLGGVPHSNILVGRELEIEQNNRCQACHADIAAVYASSAHGIAAASGKDGALCKDCHGVHNIKRPEDPASSAYRLNVPQTCTKCHQGSVQKSYDYSFHGTSVKLGYQKGATCADCHGTHQILGPENPQSTVSKENLPQTCAQCHLQAQPNFANGSEHVVPQDKQAAFPLWVIWKIFIALILFDIFKDGSIAVLELIRRLLNSRK